LRDAIASGHRSSSLQHNGRNKYHAVTNANEKEAKHKHYVQTDDVDFGHNGVCVKRQANGKRRVAVKFKKWQCGSQNGQEPNKVND
jgi:hypothetical protein